LLLLAEEVGLALLHFRHLAEQKLRKGSHEEKENKPPEESE
jgi:hypothetical protein